ncbi:hypothetical protein BASA50_010933 [Batrachochytrium salamandrivorans]|uniref:Nudix hydrolase domain-containing protein n=1 Tax=Batrachochytrium salamandrivorans TaxID=1357716 RepID=A0ABQ8EX89_9FUNG|nr:hypothetical protein BASA62_004858 [Batrachochytrium salamandrivorans]KAH6588070.1 hypothetical protein BASA50_010933 [Batrachochytrium salamandrivorans]KAH6591429.1 hypothetical protein BASA61_004940 [Batrachochytrium salamandrivorans]KAH9252687.1 hypothetical protein BASA81_009380 [Batrachochytrium salamandrivorans]KAH9267510.1 hypothetical protein BASA83_009899 [Batrachochytrium salamandrivorans]
MSVEQLKAEVQRQDPLPIVAEQQSYKRFLTVWSRRVKFPDGREVDWDVAGHGTLSPAFATVFPYNTETKKVRLIVEYAQGPNLMSYTLAAGGFDPRKHADIQETAICELSEEAKLCNGKWIRLIPDAHNGIPELKWSRNRFVPFLVINAEEDITPLARDAEECIETLDVTLDELQHMILNGLVMLPSVQTTLMAMDWLRKNSYIQ